MKMLNKFLKVCLFLTVVVGVLLAGLFILPGFFGYDVASASGVAMEPDIEKGSLLYIKRCDPAGVEIGDIAAFSDGNSVVSGKITYIDYETNTIYTRFNNSEIISGRNFSELDGKTNYHIDYIGYIYDIIFCKRGIIISISMMLSLLILTTASDLSLRLRAKKELKYE